MITPSDIHIIAEAGSNHNGSLGKAVALANIAANAKADSVKYQIIFPDELYLPGDYEYGHYDIKEVIRIRREGMLSEQEYESLAAHCQSIGIPFAASVFDPKGLELITKFDPPYIKIASCDLNNIRLLRKVAERGIRMIISTGMSTLLDIEKSIRAIYETGFNDIVLLHCVSIYPATLKMTNLSFLEELKKFGFPIGFSDHTATSIAACIALAKGATWFEKHFTEDRTQAGFDHRYAMESSELKQYVEDIHDALTAMQSTHIKLSDDELYTRKRARRSLYASKDLVAGHTITNEDVLIVRPEAILSADDIDDIVGKKLKSDLKQYAPFSFEVID